MAEQVEQRIVNINDKQYLFDSLDEESKGAFEQAMEINQKIEGKKVEIRDLTYGRQYLVDFLGTKADTFTDVTPEVEAPEAEAETKAEAKA